MRTIIELSTYNGQFKALFILYLAFLSDGKHRFNNMWNLNPLMDKLDARTRMSRKIRLYGDKWKT